uniref:unspecific monooxygenase n=1 Tax=Lerema accius TaxID=691651 RepID=A0A2Z6JNJ2_9NEOP|nr:TPA_inf: cytochrome P450 CYP332A38 [Lerema accius]
MDVKYLSFIAQLFILFIITCLIILCGFFYHNYSYWKKKGVPYEEPFLFFGNLTFLMRKSFWDYCYTLRKKYPSDYVGIFLAWRPALVVQTPELARRILVKDHEYFQDRSLYSRESDALGSLNLFTMKNPLWTDMRHEISPMFTAARLKQFAVLMNLNATELVRKIKRDFIDDNKPVNLKELFSMYTSDTVAYTTFGIRVSALSDQDSPLWYISSHMVKWTFRRGFELTMIFLVPAIAAMLRCCFFSASATEFVKKIFWNVVNERKKMQAGNSDNKDLVNHLLKLKDNFKIPAESGSELADNLMLAQAAVFILGSIETSSTTLSYTLHELAYNPVAQEKLYNEVKEAIENSGKDVLDYDELLELKYLNACVNETLRKHAPVSYLDRICSRDYKLNDELTIEKGVPVLINILALHHDEKVYPEPDKWRPERMLLNHLDNNNFSFLPFGEGPRFCIGRRYGMLQVRVALAQMIMNYKFQPAVPYEVKTDPYSVMLSPDKGLSVKFISR